jgi:hypothetical protein
MGKCFLNFLLILKNATFMGFNLSWDQKEIIVSSAFPIDFYNFSVL